jgi:hypothetical protein
MIKNAEQVQVENGVALGYNISVNCIHNTIYKIAQACIGKHFSGCNDVYYTIRTEGII